MKTTLFFLLAMLIVSSLYAQEEQSKKSDEKVQTIFNSVELWRVSGFGGSTISVSSIGGDLSIMNGGGGGIILNRFYFGAYGESTTNSINLTEGEGFQNVNFEHGGFILGYELNHQRVIHPVFSTRIGWGNVNALTATGTPRRLISDQTFVIVPTVSAEINFTRFFKMNIGAEYRRVFGMNELGGLSNNDFSSPGAYISFVFGWF